MGAVRANAGPSKAFFAYADKALLAIGPVALATLQPENVAPMLGCYVVSSAVFDTVREYTRRVARAGVVRAVFTSRAEAQSSRRGLRRRRHCGRRRAVQRCNLKNQGVGPALLVHVADLVDHAGYFKRQR